MRHLQSMAALAVALAALAAVPDARAQQSGQPALTGNQAAFQLAQYQYDRYGRRYYAPAPGPYTYRAPQRGYYDDGYSRYRADLDARERQVTRSLNRSEAARAEELNRDAYNYYYGYGYGYR